MPTIKLVWYVGSIDDDYFYIENNEFEFFIHEQYWIIYLEFRNLK